MTRLTRLVIVLFAVMQVQSLARADGSLVTDISSHLISVTSDFKGTDLLLFGVIKTADAYDLSNNGDIVVIVRGPQRKVIVRKKERVIGIWANKDSVLLADVPGFYAVASNKPLTEITTDATLQRLRIGHERLNFSAAATITDLEPFKEAVIRQQIEKELYVSSESAVYFLGNALFRTSIHFPANVPVGNYIAEVYLFREGELISAQTSPLFIKKFGLGRQIFDFAHKYPYIHGILAIMIALLAGWIASAIFRKD